MMRLSRSAENLLVRAGKITGKPTIQKIAIENRCYGYRRVTAALNQQDWDGESRSGT
jgi:hypothetical protein